MEDIIVFGDTDYAKSVAANCQRNGVYKIRGFTADAAYCRDADTIPFESLEKHYKKDDVGILVAVSYSHMNETRRAICQRLLQGGYRLVSYISPKALVDTDKIGIGCIISDLCMVAYDVKIGNFTHLGGACNIAHSCEIGDYCHFASQVALAGFVTVHDNCFFGTHATVKDNIEIGDHAMIGAAAYVHRNVKPYTMVAAPKGIRCKIEDDYDYK